MHGALCTSHKMMPSFLQHHNLEYASAALGCTQVVLELQERNGSPEAVKRALCGLLALQPAQVGGCPDIKCLICWALLFK